jgi:very-short-patch-repair endonuclease
MARLSRSDRDSARHPDRIKFARDQRKQANEFAMDVWQMLRASRIRGKKFRREYPIPPYTVDFVCLSLKLIVEVDGKDHFTEAGMRADAQRDQFLRDQGFEVIRVDGYQVTQDPTSVRRFIEDAVDKQIELE